MVSILPMTRYQYQTQSGTYAQQKQYIIQTNQREKGIPSGAIAEVKTTI